MMTHNNDDVSPRSDSSSNEDVSRVEEERLEQEHMQSNERLFALTGLNNYILEALCKTHGEANRKNVQRYLKRSLGTIVEDLTEVATSTLPHTYFATDETVKVMRTDQLRKRWGQITIGGVQKEANSLLLPVVCEVLRTGTTGVATAVRIRKTVMDALMAGAIEAEEDFTTTPRFDFTGVETIETLVDRESLREYVKGAELAAERERLMSTGNAGRVLRNLTAAKAILGALTKEGYLVQEAAYADSGRCYLKGLNLQTAPKEVRHAALGRSHLYDMRVGAFAVMAALAKDYCAMQGIAVEFHTIKDYIRNKDQYRMKITQQVYPQETAGFRDISDYKGFYGFYNVKNALTAIGFGAKQNINSVWKDHKNQWQQTSLLKAFKGNKEPTQRFIECPKAAALIAEFVECSKIVEMRMENDEVFSSFFKFTDKMSAAQRLALVYQSMESTIISAFIDLAGQDKLLLPVHDGVYLKHRIDYANVWSQLSVPFISDTTYIQFDHTEYGYKRLEEQANTQQTEHERLIAEQERIAETYTSPFLAPSAPAKKATVQTPWGEIDADVWAAMNSASI